MKEREKSGSGSDFFISMSTPGMYLLLKTEPPRHFQIAPYLGTKSSSTRACGEPFHSDDHILLPSSQCHGISCSYGIRIITVNYRPKNVWVSNEMMCTPQKLLPEDTGLFALPSPFPSSVLCCVNLLSASRFFLFRFTYPLIPLCNPSSIQSKFLFSQS